MTSYNFNAAQFEPKYGFSGSLPPGKYRGVIVDSSLEPTAKGGYMALTVQVIEGSLVGQKMIDRLNLNHPTPKVVEIANKQLSAYCYVLNVPVITDTAQLHNIPFCFEVDWQKGEAPTAEKPEGGFTQIVAVADVNGNEPGKAKGPAPVAAAAPPPPPAPPADVAPAGGGWGGAAPAAQPAASADEAPQPPAANGGGWGGQPAGQPPAAPPAAQGWAQNGAGAGNGGWGNK